MKKRQLRSAFSMFMAIMVIILMATISMFVMNLSGKIVKSTTTQFQREQAELYAKSYTEYAIMAVTGNNRNVDCLETINGQINGYRIRTELSYIVNGAEVNTAQCAAQRVLSAAVATVDMPMNVIIDVYVDYQDLDNIAPNAPWMTVHRRTVQKI